MNYATGMIIEEKDYTDAAIWCNQNGMTMCEVFPDKGENGKEASSRLFEIIHTPEPDDEEKQKSVRNVRNLYLNDTEKYMMPDYPIDAELREKIKTYRQYLRDYTLQNGWQEENPEPFERWNK